MVNPIDSLLHKFKRDTDHIDAIIPYNHTNSNNHRIITPKREKPSASCHDALRLKHILHVQYKDYNSQLCTRFFCSHKSTENIKKIFCS